MKINCLRIGNGKKKILISEDFFYSRYKGEIDELGNLCEYSFFFLQKSDYTKFFKFNMTRHFSRNHLEKVYLYSKGLRDYYESLINFMKNEGITRFLAVGTGMYWHPEFIKALENINIKPSLFTVDDDADSIKYCSLPYTRYYLNHFHVGVMYSEKLTIADILKQNGSKNPVWLPLGALLSHINKNIEFDNNKDIEICYIGNINPLKFYRLYKLKKVYGDRFKLYGAQGNGDFKSFKGIFYKICNKIFGFGYVQKLTDLELCDVYSRTKIGFNMHLIPYKGPSNVRLYELAINGVMQLCDNKIGIKKVFEEGKEIVTYDGIDDAIEKINYYLLHDDERISIAKKGYERCVRENYTATKTLITIFNII